MKRQVFWSVFFTVFWDCRSTKLLRLFSGNLPAMFSNCCGAERTESGYFFVSLVWERERSGREKISLWPEIFNHTRPFWKHFFSYNSKVFSQSCFAQLSWLNSAFEQLSHHLKWILRFCVIFSYFHFCILLDCFSNFSIL